MPHLINVNQIESIVNEFCSKNDERFEQIIFKDTSTAWTQESNKSKYKLVILTDVCTVNIYNSTTGTLTEVANLSEASWTGRTQEWNDLGVQGRAAYAGKKVYITDDYMQNIPTMIGASANDGGYKGLVPTPNAGQQKALLRGDGTFGADENLAPPYDVTSTYAVGDLCTNLGKLWKCNTAISTAHAWNASEWDDVPISELITPRILATTTGNGVKTVSDILEELRDTLFDNTLVPCRLIISDASAQTIAYYNFGHLKNTTGNKYIKWTRIDITNTGAIATNVFAIRTNSVQSNTTTVPVNNPSTISNVSGLSDVVGNGTIFEVVTI